MPVQVRIEGSESLNRKFAALSEAARGRTLERAVTAGALIIQNAAKENAPYLTGNLRRSIHIGGHGDLAPDRGDISAVTGAKVPDPEVAQTSAAVYVGTDVEYARRVEYGFDGQDRLGRTYNQPAQPYLRPAIDDNGREVAREIGDAFRDLIRAAVR